MVEIGTLLQEENIHTVFIQEQEKNRTNEPQKHNLNKNKASLLGINKSTHYCRQILRYSLR